VTPASIATPRAALIALTLFFVGVTYWWLTRNTAMPDFDTGTNLLIAFDYHDMIEAGHLTRPFTTYSDYPPLVHLIGALATLIGDLGVKAPVLSQNLIYVPLLVLGCYGTGSIAFDRRVGVLAALFALGVPMVISQFHAFLLDAPTAAMVAVSVWLCLASDRVARTGYSVAAGAAIGLGLLTKSPSVLFVVGFVAVMTIRGGWRNWRNLLLLVGVAAVLGLPWNLKHLSDQVDLLRGAASHAPINWYDSVPYPGRWSFGDFSWYFWNLLNNQLYLPLTVFFLVGIVVATFSWLRTRSPSDYTPELLAGGFVGYALITGVAINDPRYTLPCLVYIAVLGTAWIVTAPRVLRLASVAALILTFALNTATVSFGLASPLRIHLSGARSSPIREHQLTLIGDGYVRGPPDRDDHMTTMIADLPRDGVRSLFYDDRSVNYVFFNDLGLAALARAADLEARPFSLRALDLNLLGPGQVLILRRPASASPGVPACTRLDDGSGVYLLKGPFRGLTAGGAVAGRVHVNLFQDYEVYCPLKRGS
jgi:4-amino-4-deoxy-L-arabinose transferase-like glycosyltransferase